MPVKFLKGMVLISVLLLLFIKCRRFPSLVYKEKLTYKVDLINPVTYEKNIIERYKLFYFIDNYVMIAVPKLFIESNNLIDTLGNIVERTENNEDTIFNYFIIDMVKLKALYFDSLNQHSGKSVKADSLIQSFFLYDKNLYSKEDSIISSKYEHDGSLFEKAIPKKNADSTFSDTSIFIFSKKPLVSSNYYSLSSYADSIKKLRLVSVKLIYIEKALGLMRELSFSTENLGVENKYEMKMFIKRAIKELSSIKQ